MISNDCVQNGTECSIKIAEKITIRSGDDSKTCPYELALEAVHFLTYKIPFKPKVGIICGSGLGFLADAIENRVEIPYEEIPNFLLSTVKGHAGKLVYGYISGVTVVCMQGRFHYFEGYPLWKCTMPVRVMKMLGVIQLVISNAAGGLKEGFKVGDIMIIKDHVNIPGLAGNNPLRGPNEERFGPRFPSMHGAYNKQIIQVAKQIAADINIGEIVHEGVYVSVGGPNFETVAELKMLRMLGCDAVGMSTVHEAITARHCNMGVFAFSLITNVCITDYESTEDVNHEEVLTAAKSHESELKRFISKVLVYIDNNISSNTDK